MLESEYRLCRISIHAPPRGATLPGATVRRLQKNFNSRPSARGDDTRVGIPTCNTISIHAPPRGATCRLKTLQHSQHAFQFTPLREGRRRDENAFSPPDFISIHAPPRGATSYRRHYRGVDEFQFTPLREGRRNSELLCNIGLHFNSRPSARGDKFTLRTDKQTLISIHAPPRGATTWTTLTLKLLIFQFTPLREGRRETDTQGRANILFQFTPLREGRLRRGRRPERGCISIHAPPRGATAQQARQHDAGCISIHAPPRGATAKDMQFLQIFCSTLTNQHGLTIVPRNLSRLFW